MPQSKRAVKAVPKEPETREKIVVSLDDESQPKWNGREIRDFEAVQTVKFVNLMSVFQSGEVPYDTLLAFVWVQHRRVDPSFTFDDALDLTPDDWDIEGLTVADADPTAEPVEPTAMATGS